MKVFFVFLFLEVICPHLLAAAFRDFDNLKIQLQDFRQSDCYTECSHGLLSSYDKIILKANVWNTQYIEMNTYVYVLSVHMRKESTFEKIKEINLTSCFDLKSNYFTCKMEQNNYKIIITLLAKVDMDRADFKIALSYDDLRLESNSIKIGTVYDAFQTFHYLNGRQLHSKHCEINISRHSPLMFCCGKDTNVSTTIELYRNEKIVIKGEHCVSYKELRPEEQPIFFYQCNICNTTLENITCQFFMEETTHLEQENENITSLWLRDFFIACIIFICLAISIASIKYQLFRRNSPCMTNMRNVLFAGFKSSKSNCSTSRSLDNSSSVDIENLSSDIDETKKSLVENLLSNDKNDALHNIPIKVQAVVEKTDVTSLKKANELIPSPSLKCTVDYTYIYTYVQLPKSENDNLGSKTTQESINDVKENLSLNLDQLARLNNKSYVEPLFNM